MDALPPLNVLALLRRYNLHPDKSLGQNFLVDERSLQKIVDAAEISADEAVLEIGPGLGSLTRYLANRARYVVAVELDARLLPALEEALAPQQNIRLVQGDILNLDPSLLISDGDYLVVANIPYYITSALIRHLLEAHPQPRRLVLTVQEEVAQRICAAPGKMSLLALSVQVYGQPRVVAHLPAGAFYPAPKVDSAVLRVELLPAPRIPSGLLDIFFRLAKAGFSQKRKTLRNALAAGMGWQPTYTSDLLIKAGIDPQRRAETLSLEEWGEVVTLVEQAQRSD
jgi:16S rRNA (adenine1518-N6/adenine1519-N6)-dimethyltransferase